MSDPTPSPTPRDDEFNLDLKTVALTIKATRSQVLSDRDRKDANDALARIMDRQDALTDRLHTVEREKKELQDRLDTVLPPLTPVAAEARVEALETAKDGAYRERDQLVAVLTKVFPAHMALHTDPDWEDEWRHIICVHLPTGQATWHIHDSEQPLFAHLGQTADHWDGHTTDEKYARLAALDPTTGERP